MMMLAQELAKGAALARGAGHDHHTAKNKPFGGMIKPGSFDLHPLTEES